MRKCDLESEAHPQAEQKPPPQKAPTIPPRRSGGRNVRTFFGSLGARKAPARAADAYNATFETPAEPGPSESGVTGPSDWIMEPSPPPSPAAPAEAEAEAVAAAPAAEAPEAFGTSADAWPEPPRSATPAPTESGGWGIAPVTPPTPSRTPSPRFGAPVVASATATAPATVPAAAEPAPTPEPEPRQESTATSHSSAPRQAEAEPSAATAASGSLDSLFGGASVKSQDAEAAEMLAGAFGPPQTTATPAQQFPGQPARAASSELSLDHVFRDTPRKSGAVRTTGGFSFDQFFSDDAAGRDKSEDTDADKKKTPGGSSEQSGGEEAQFSSWLEGLKKK